MMSAKGYGDRHHQEAMALDWAHAALGCQLHHHSCNPLDPRGKAEPWSTKDNLAKNCGSGNEEDEPQLGHQSEAGQWQTGVNDYVTHGCSGRADSYCLVARYPTPDTPLLQDGPCRDK